MSNPKKSSSYNAFTYVDNLVSKPIIGSDGAAKWQEWNTKEETTIYKSQNNAPHAPIKTVDKLSTGMKSIHEEREREEQQRKAHGFQSMGEGYKHFNKTKEVKQSKEHIMALKRIRPDHVTYYYPASTFEGYKKDYVFTTRKPRGTGYYWDGMDTYKELIGKGSDTIVDNDLNEKDKAEEKPKKKRKISVSKQEKKEHEEILKSIKAIQWKKTIDKSTNKVYYYNIETKETSWECPKELLEFKEKSNMWKEAIDKSTGKTYYYNKDTKETVWERPKELGEKDENDDVWKSTIDKTSGKTYYYNKVTKETSWNKPY